MNNPENIIVYVSIALGLLTIIAVLYISNNRRKKRIEWAKALCEKLGIPATEEKIKRITYRESPKGDYFGGDGGWGDSGGGDSD